MRSFLLFATSSVFYRNALVFIVDDVVGGELATKADLLTTQNALKADLKDLELKMEQRFSKFDARFVRLEVLMALMLAVLLIPTLNGLFASLYS